MNNKKGDRLLFIGVIKKVARPLFFRGNSPSCSIYESDPELIVCDMILHHENVESLL
jgi:hypothetical protein